MSIERAAFLICCLFILLAVFGCIVAHEGKKGPPKKRNIRVPRETLWERTNRYHGEPK